MKRRVLVVFVVGIIIFCAFSAQKANAQNTPNAQRIIGTWVDQTGNTWVFNANESMTRQSWLRNSRTGEATRSVFEYKYGVTETKLILVDSDYGNSDAESLLYDISISTDGKTLIIEGEYTSRSSNSVLSSINRNKYWLKRK
jgi:hypothetical protein